MAAPMTPKQFLAQAAKWGVKLDLKRHPDWATHNRNGVKAFGPVYGTTFHHTGSSAQLSIVDYCYRGDPQRSLPGPLALGVCTDDGILHMIGWGRANTQGQGDGRVLTAMKAGRVPPFPPATDNTDGNSCFYGWEFCASGASDPYTRPQFDTAVSLACAILDFHKWSNVQASVIGHYQWTRRKSGDPAYSPNTDARGESLNWPVFIAAVAKRLGGSAASLPPAPKPPTSEADMPLNAADIIAIRAAVQAELEEYGARLWGSSGTAGSYVAKSTARETETLATAKRIEDDTDDDAAPPAPAPPKA